MRNQAFVSDLNDKAFDEEILGESGKLNGVQSYTWFPAPEKHRFIRKPNTVATSNANKQTISTE